MAIGSSSLWLLNRNQPEKKIHVVIFHLMSLLDFKWTMSLYCVRTSLHYSKTTGQL